MAKKTGTAVQVNTAAGGRSFWKQLRKQKTLVLMALWGVGAALLATAYGLVDTAYIPKFLLGVSFPGIVVSVSCHLFTEFALRPVAAQALEAGPPPVRLAVWKYSAALLTD